MEDYSKNIIKSGCTILDALKALNELRTKYLDLFVEDEQGKVIGVVTDGDLRRGIIAGAQLNCAVDTVMNRKYAYFENGDIDVKQLKYFKSKGMSLIPSLSKDGCIEKIYNIGELKSVLPIDAVLMAGGKGERLRPLTEKTPKPLLKVGEKAIIDHNIDRLISYGIQHISVTVNYLKEQLEEHFAEQHNGVQVQTVQEPKYLGTIGSIRFVKEFHNDTILVMNSDLFTNINYEDFYLHFKEHDAEMSVAAVPYTVSIPYGIFDLDGRNIQGLIEKPTYNYYANAGIYLIKKSALDYIPEDTFFNATDLIETLIKQGRKVIRFPLNGTWIDIGNPQEYKKAQDLVKHL